jgi:hypothetical protein
VRRSYTLAFIVLSILAVIFIGGCNDFFTSGDSITTLTISPVSRLAAAGDKINYTASGTTVNGDTKDITSSATWSSSDTNIATISSSGIATAVAAGNTTISAKQDNGSANATLVITALPLDHITVTPTDPTVAQTTGTYQFTATGTFTDGSTQNLSTVVQWSSGTTSVATINSNGLATLLTAGTTQITASITTSSGSKTDSTNLTVQ